MQTIEKGPDTEGSEQKTTAASGKAQARFSRNMEPKKATKSTKTVKTLKSSKKSATVKSSKPAITKQTKSSTLKAVKPASPRTAKPKTALAKTTTSKAAKSKTPKQTKPAASKTTKDTPAKQTKSVPEKKPTPKATRQTKQVKPAPAKTKKPAPAKTKKPAPDRQTQPVTPEIPDTGEADAPPPIKWKASDFQKRKWVVYPSHGPGKILGNESHSVGGTKVEFLVVDFVNEKMILRIPKAKIAESGLRPISSNREIRTAMQTLKEPAHIKRTMWSRRAQEYEAKLHSGSLVQIAEVLRDLYRPPDGPEQSFSERELYKEALLRFSKEISAVESIPLDRAGDRLERSLRKAT